MRAAAPKPPIAAKRWFRPRRSGNPSFPTRPRLIAATAGPRNPPVIPRSTSAMSTGVKRPKRQDQGRTGNRRDPKRDQWPLRPDHVEQFPARYLDQQSGKAADGQDQPYFYFCPTSPRQIQGDKRPASGQYPREKQVQPVQTAQALLRGVVLG